MTRSRVILLLWIFLTLATLGFYARCLIGITLIWINPLEIVIDNSIWIQHDADTRRLAVDTLRWNEIRDSPDRKSLHWDELGFGTFEFGLTVQDDADYRYLATPLWFPFVILSVLLIPIFLSSRRREQKLRTIQSADN